MLNNCPLRRVERFVAPLLEPVSLSEAKLFLRVDGAAEDALISDMIAAARLTAEGNMQRSLITQSWRVTYGDNAPKRVLLAYGDVQAITSVKLIASNGDETMVDAGEYYLNAMQELLFENMLYAAQVQIEYVAGYGDAASDVPADIVQAILVHVAYLYEQRDSVLPPASAKLCYDRYREVAL